LVVSGASTDFNPTLSKDEIARAYEEDFQGANAEYGAQFRNDISAFIERQTVLDCINVGVKEIGPRKCRYYGFVDPSGGSSDSMVLCIAHQEDGLVVVDALLERIPPFSPSDVVHEFAATLKRYGLSRVEGDKYAAQWTVEAFSKAGITYRYCELTTSDLFRELVPALNTRSVHLLDNPRAIGQLCALERRVGRAGRDSISHAPGGHDDVACAIAGAIYLAGTHAAQRGEVRTGVIGPGGVITWLDSRKARVSALDASHNECIPSRRR
jgi:hypothetical protein